MTSWPFLLGCFLFFMPNSLYVSLVVWEFETHWPFGVVSGVQQEPMVNGIQPQARVFSLCPLSTVLFVATLLSYLFFGPFFSEV